MKHKISALIGTLLLTASIGAFANVGTGPATIAPDGTTTAEMFQRQGGVEFPPDAI